MEGAAGDKRVVTFRILGPLAVEIAGADEAPKAVKPRALLLRLLVDANHSVRADRLVEDLWEGTPPPKATQVLQTYISQLRKVVGADRLVTEGGGYRIVANPGEIDAGRFETEVEAGREAAAREGWAEVAERMREALSCWRGAALADVAGVGWSLPETTRLEELRWSSTELLLEAQLALGHDSEVVSAAESAVGDHPLRERLWALLITAYYRQGRQADALRAYQTLRGRLAEELGIDPSPELRHLESAVLNQNLAPARGAAQEAPGALPTGVVTFLLTDVVGSTQLWERAPRDMSDALRRHDEIIRTAIESHSGRLLKARGEGDSTFSVFQRASDAVVAARDLQSGLAHSPWPPATTIGVRAAIHTGEAVERDGDFYGPTVNLAARLVSAGSAGQTLVSATTAALVGHQLLVDLGEHRFAGITDTRRVFQLGAGTFPPLHSLGSTPSNLPAQRTSFVGRHRELEEVAGLVRSDRLVTLTGVGGVGKTRLATQVAARMAEEFPDGIWLVELAPLTDAALVADTVASAIGAPVSPGVDPPDVVCRFLAPRRALVVLDNCEHVIAATAGLVDRLASEAPQTTIMATSREPLGVAGESVWKVPSLSVESIDGVADAVALLAERAARVRPGFSLDENTTPAVAVLCRRLDGIPLAIELAAARAKVMSIEQIADRLDERFRLLTRGGRTAVARQQTLQGALDWSYDLLAKEERELFDSLGVFAGDFDLAAAGAVASMDEFVTLDLLQQLTDKSMVEPSPSPDRYRLLESLRQYAWERLVAAGRLSDCLDRHAAYFIDMAGHQAARMGRPGQQVDALDRMETDFDNLRAALTHLIGTGQSERAARLARRIIGLFNIRRPGEGYDWLRQITAISEALPAKIRSRLLADAAYAAMTAGEARVWADLARDSVDVGGDDAPAVAHWLLGMWGFGTADIEEVMEESRRAVDIASVTGDATTQAIATAQLANILALAGDESGARELMPEAIRLAEALGNPTIICSTRLVVGGSLSILGSVEEATAILRVALQHADAGGPITASDIRALYAFLVDDAEEAVRMLLPALPIARDRLSGFHQLPPLLCSAKVLTGLGKHEIAARVLRAYDRHVRNLDFFSPQAVIRYGPATALNPLRPMLDILGGVLFPSGPAPKPAVDHEGGVSPARSWPLFTMSSMLGSPGGDFWPLVDAQSDRLDDAALDEQLRIGAGLTPAQALQLSEDVLTAFIASSR